jgi:hypothetical protein
MRLVHLPWLSRHEPAAAARYRVTARAARLGYNVLCTDSDIVVFDDVYRYFKSPPFSEYQVINQAEVGGHAHGMPLPRSAEYRTEQNHRVLIE